MFSKQMVKPHNKEITHACNYFSTNNACPFASPHKDDQYHGKKQYGISSSCVSCLLNHWGRVKHICVSKVKLIGSDNGLSPGLHQVIIWTNAAILLMWPLGTKFRGMLIEIHTFHSRKRIWKCRLQNGGNCVSTLMRQIPPMDIWPDFLLHPLLVYEVHIILT